MGLLDPDCGLDLHSDADHPVRNALDWTKFYHKEKIDWVFGEPPRDAQVHFSRLLLGRELKDAQELLAVYAALLAAGTDLHSRGIAMMIRGVREGTVRRCMRLFEGESALRAANEACLPSAGCSPKALRASAPKPLEPCSVRRLADQRKGRPGGRISGIQCPIIEHRQGGHLQGLCAAHFRMLTFRH